MRRTRLRTALLLSVAMLAGAVAPASAQSRDRGALAYRVPEGVRFDFQGPIGRRIEANLRAWLLTAPAANPAKLGMFRVRDRKPPPDLVPWAGEFVGKYLISAIQARRMVRSPELETTIRETIDALIAAQADDGYLGPFPRDQRLLGQWDLWGHEHVMLALQMYYRDTHYEPAWQACLKAADLICRTYLDGSRRVLDAGSHEMNMAVIHMMARLYRLTGNERYLQMTRHIEKDWESAGDYLRTGITGTPFYQTPRPRWESLHDLQGLVELFLITGEAAYQRAFASHWKSIARYDRHNTGAFSTGEGAIGNPYLPGAIETCCTVAWTAITADYLQLTGESTAADELEWSTWNAILGAQHPSGRWWTYDTPMDGVRRASAHSIVFQARPGAPELNCCSVNGPRGLGVLSEWAILVNKGEVLLNYYGPGVFQFRTPSGVPVKIEQVTDYPVTGRIEIHVSPEQTTQFDLKLRIPTWAVRSKYALNDQALRPMAAGRYLSVGDRLWTAGDKVTLELNMQPRVWTGECEQAGRSSIFVGPLLLAFDPHYNTLDENELPRVNPYRLRVAQRLAPFDAFEPIVLCEVAGKDGRPMRLCDFATAGAHGNAYRTWLEAGNHATPPRWLKYAPLRPESSAVAGATVIADDLRGKPEPSTGRLLSAIKVVPAPGRDETADTAVAFNGRDARVQYELGSLWGEFTVAAWLYLEDYSDKTYQQVFSAWAGGSNDPLRVSVMGRELVARIEAGSLHTTAGVPIERRRWYHVAAVRSRLQLDLYVDGELRASTPAPPNDCPSAVRSCAIGANPNYPGDEYLSGRLQQFLLTARPLPAEEIRELAR